jgi:hypothetical protein
LELAITATFALKILSEANPLIKTFNLIFVEVNCCNCLIKEKFVNRFVSPYLFIKLNVLKLIFSLLHHKFFFKFEKIKI